MGLRFPQLNFSPVRRFFCLLVTFDVLFSGLLWVITVIVTGRDIQQALYQQESILRVSISAENFSDNFFPRVETYFPPEAVFLAILDYEFVLSYFKATQKGQNYKL
jgi:hypothetical protein